MSAEPRYVAILEMHERTIRKAVLVPSGQSLEMDEGDITRRWLWPHLGTEWHLVEFVEIEAATSTLAPHP